MAHYWQLSLCAHILLSLCAHILLSALVSAGHIRQFPPADSHRLGQPHFSLNCSAKYSYQLSLCAHILLFLCAHILALTQSETEKKYPQSKTNKLSQVTFCMSGRFYVLNVDTYRVGMPQDMPGPSSSSHDLREAPYPIITQQGSSSDNDASGGSAIDTRTHCSSNGCSEPA